MLTQAVGHWNAQDDGVELVITTVCLALDDSLSFVRMLCDRLVGNRLLSRNMERFTRIFAREENSIESSRL